MILLGLETSCDETSVAVVENGVHVRSCVVSSQIRAHKRYGGVVPELASRMHTEVLPWVLRQAFSESGVTWSDISGIAVTHHPGLEGALLIGVTAAKTLAHVHQKPLYGVNHLHGHLVSPILSHSLPFPHIAVLISGGHTQLWRINSFVDMHLLAQTRDDAMGEAFDKVARLLGLGYPGGPQVERYAAQSLSPVEFPVPLRQDPTSFSFSGLKTAVMVATKGYNTSATAGALALTDSEIANICAGFQRAAVQHVLDKLLFALRSGPVLAVTIVGGVAANRYVVDRIREAVPVPVYTGEKWCTDNAAMIAAAAYHMPDKTYVSDLTDLVVVPTGC